MTTENQQQATQATEAATSEAPSGQEPTLEQVYKDFDVKLPDEQAQPQYQPAQPHQQPTSSTLSIPDPIGQPEQFKAWLEARVRTESVLTQSNQQVAGMLQEILKTQQQAALMKDINHAVDTVNEHVKLPDHQKRLIEFALEDKARQDPRFKQVWDNRARNPIAYQRALVAVSREIGEVFSVRADPQLRADREALKASQSGSAVSRDTPGPELPAAALAPAGSPDFERWWASQARTYQ